MCAFDKVFAALQHQNIFMFYKYSYFISWTRMGNISQKKSNALFGFQAKQKQEKEKLEQTNTLYTREIDERKHTLNKKYCMFCVRNQLIWAPHQQHCLRAHQKKRKSKPGREHAPSYQVTYVRRAHAAHCVPYAQKARCTFHPIRLLENS